MAVVVALVPDLLFGSRVQADLTAAGHEVALHSQPDAARAAAHAADVFVVDLVNDEVDGIGLVRSMQADGELSSTRTLGFFSHVEEEVRQRANAAGFDLVVPRSRMARDGASLVTSLAAPNT